MSGVLTTRGEGSQDGGAQTDGGGDNTLLTCTEDFVRQPSPIPSPPTNVFLGAWKETVSAQDPRRGRGRERGRCGAYLALDVKVLNFWMCYVLYVAKAIFT